MKAEIAASDFPARLKHVLAVIGGRSRWYREEAAARQPVSGDRPQSRRGPHPAQIDPWEKHVVETVAKACPWYGYKKIALICERLDEPIPRRKVYRIMKEAGLLHQRKRRLEERARQEVARLYQLLPKAPNELWQTDVTYIPVPGYGWWYGITVIDYYSRYLLALHFTHSYSAIEAAKALRRAVEEAERYHGSLTQPVFLVTDNGPSFIAQRFHETLKQEEVYWNLYADPWDARGKLSLFQERYNVARPHWALVAADPASAPGQVLTPHEVYMKGNKVNPPPWSRWVGWLEKDQKTEAQPSNRNEVRVSA